MTPPRSRSAGTRFWVLYEYLAMIVGLSLLAGLCLLWLPFALLLHPLLPARHGRRLGRRAISIGFRFYLSLLERLCATRFDLTSLDTLRGAPPQILIANHPSLLDAVMVVSRLPNVVCIMKASLMRNLLLGSAARLAGYIPNSGPLEVVLHAQRALGEGAHILWFPEGSRTGRPPLDRFSATPVLIARRARVPIQTLLIRYAGPRPYLGKDWPLWQRPCLPMRWSVHSDQRFEVTDTPPGDTDPAATLTRTIESHLTRQLTPRVAESTRQAS